MNLEAVRRRVVSVRSRVLAAAARSVAADRVASALAEPLEPRRHLSADPQDLRNLFVRFEAGLHVPVAHTQARLGPFTFEAAQQESAETSHGASELTDVGTCTARPEPRLFMGPVPLDEDGHEFTDEDLRLASADARLVDVDASTRSCSSTGGGDPGGGDPNDPKPTVSISTVQNGDENVIEDAATIPMIFKVSRGGDTSSELEVQLKLGSKTTTYGQVGADHSSPPFLLTIPAGETEFERQLSVYEDDKFEGTEFLTLEIVERDSYIIGQGSATMSVLDDDLYDGGGDDDPPPPGGGDGGGGPSDNGDGEHDAWVDVRLGYWNWWNGGYYNDGLPGEQSYGSTDDGPGLTTGHFIRLNADFDEYERSGSTGTLEYDYENTAQPGAIPGDGEIIPLWVRMWDDGYSDGGREPYNPYNPYGYSSYPGGSSGLPGGADRGGQWTLTWNDDLLKVWTYDRDADGNIQFDSNGLPKMLEQQSGWSDHTDNLPDPAQDNWWWGWGINAFVEGFGESGSRNDAWVKAEFAPDEGDAVQDELQASVLDIDIDIDSDNNQSLTRSANEERFEDKKAGKLLVVNRDDTDEDQILDYADGYGKFSGLTNGNDSQAPEATPYDVSGEEFAPVAIQLPAISEAGDIVTFRYDAADPDAVTVETEYFDTLYNTTIASHTYRTGGGLLRLWARDGNDQRLVSDFIKPDQPYTVGQLENMLAADGDSLLLFVESVNGKAVSTSISVELQLDTTSYKARDSIRVFSLDPLIGMSENEVEGYNVIRGDGYDIVGTSDNDIIIGTSYHESIIAGAGDDIILAGRNEIWAATSDDDPNAVAGDYIDGGQGSDLIFSWFGNNTIVKDDNDFRSGVEATRAITQAAGSSAASNLALAAAAEPADRPYLAGSQVLAAYFWMYGFDDPWYQAFRELGGSFVTVPDAGLGHGISTIDWGDTGAFESPDEYLVKIEHSAGNVLNAASLLRKEIMSAAWWDRTDWQEYFFNEGWQKLVDGTIDGEPLQEWRELRSRNFEYAAQVAAVAGELYLNLALLPAGAGADAVLTLSDLLEGDLTSLLGILPLIPGSVSNLASVRALASGPGDKVRAYITHGNKNLFSLGGSGVGADVIRAIDPATQAPRRIGFVVRRDFVNGAVVPTKVRAFVNPATKKASIVLGEAQVTGGTHAPTIDRIAQGMAQGVSVQAKRGSDGAQITIPARAYTHGTLNRSFRTATGRFVQGIDGRPDLLFVGEDGKLYLYEVMSPGDTFADLSNRINGWRQDIINNPQLGPSIIGDFQVLRMD